MACKTREYGEKFRLFQAKVYEMPVLAYVNDALIQEGKARISSIIFSTIDKAIVHLTEVICKFL